MKHHLGQAIFWFVILWGISSQISLNAQNLDSIQHLQEVIISKTIYRETIPAQKLSGVDLKNLNSHSVADALRYFSGVQLKDYGGIGGIKTINIRSMGSNHVGVFYDGIQLGNAQNGIIDLGMYSLDNISEISIYNGQKSEIFQTAKDFVSAGSVYIKSKVPTFDNGRTSNVKATMRTGSFDLVNPSVLIENKFSESVRSSFNAEWVNSSGKYEFRYRRKDLDGNVAYDTTAVRQNGDINATRLEANIYGDINKGAWQLKAYNYTSERGVPGAIVNNVWRRGERMKDMNAFVQGTIKTDNINKFRFMMNGKYAFYSTNYINYNQENDIAISELTNDLYRQKEAYVSSSMMYSILPSWDVSLAYDFQWNWLGSDRNDFIGPATRYSNFIALSSAAMVGRIKLQGSLAATFINDEIAEVNNPSPQKSLSPAFFISYKPISDKDFSLRAFAKKSFRMPTFNDLYYTDMGNPKLEPEVASQFNIGFTYEKGWRGFFSFFETKADAYYNNVKNKIVSYPKGQQFRWTMLNLGKVDIRGIDASISVGIAPARDLEIIAKIQYTYEKSIDVTNPEDTYYKDQIPYIPHHSGGVAIRATYKDWGVNYSFIYVGERYNQQENIKYNYTQPWYTHDASVYRNFKINNIKFRAFVGVSNLLSQDYDVILNYPMPKRNYRFTLSAEF